MDYNEDYCGEHSDAEDDGFSTHLLRVSKEHSELSGANTDGIQGVAELRRYGHKKVLAPFITRPIDLRSFLHATIRALEKAAELPVLRNFARAPDVSDVHEIERGEDHNTLAGVLHDSAPSGSERSHTKRRNKAENRKMLSLGLGEDSLENREFSQKMKVSNGASASSPNPSLGCSGAKEVRMRSDLRTRIRKAAPKIGGVVLDLDECCDRAPQLKTLQFRQEEHRFLSANKSNAMSFTRSTFSMPYIRDLMTRRATARRSGATPPEDNLIITVRIYRGRAPVRADHYRNIKPFMVLYCLGTNTVQDLVNVIKCPADDLVFGDMADPNVESEEVQIQRKVITEEHLVCVDSLFFTDAVNVGVSRAEHYKQWCKLTSLSDVTIEPLNGRCFLDIQLRFGVPYLYKHGLGGCEHFITFSDARLLHVDDELDQYQYPRVIESTLFRLPLCAICRARSRWHIGGTKRFPTRRAFLCDRCNSAFNYDATGQQMEPESVITVITVNDVPAQPESGSDTLSNEGQNEFMMHQGQSEDEEALGLMVAEDEDDT